MQRKRRRRGNLRYDDQHLYDQFPRFLHRKSRLVHGTRVLVVRLWRHDRSGTDSRKPTAALLFSYPRSRCDYCILDDNDNDNEYVDDKLNYVHDNDDRRILDDNEHNACGHAGNQLNVR